MQDRRTRFIALTGAAWAVLAAVGVFTSAGETPEGDSSPAKVVAYYSSHSSEVKLSAIFFAFAFLFFILFAGVLRAFLRRNPANEPLATLALAAAVGLAVTAGIGGGIEVGIAKNIHHLEPAAAQAANLVQSELFLPALIAGFVFALCSGLAILRGSQLPRWLGWVAIVLAIAFIIPPVVMVALLVLFVWSLIVSALMFLRYDSGAGQPEPAPATG